MTALLDFSFTARGAIRLVLTAAVLCSLVACGEREVPREVEMQIRQTAERKIQESERKALEAERQRLAAEKARVEAEKARQLAESKASDLQNVAWAMAFLALTALLFGIWMGSSSRKDSNAPKPPVE
jgi:hypothetical protein